MKDYFPHSKKPESTRNLLNQAVTILNAVGIPIAGLTPRRLEKMAMSFLAVAAVTESWQSAQGLDNGRALKSRDIIEFINQHFGENISSGSYDDIRRKDLKLLVLADLVINSGLNPEAATNNPTRGYSLDIGFKRLIRTFGHAEWTSELAAFRVNRSLLAETLARKRNIPKLPVGLPDGTSLELSPGSHNELQKQIIEEFLPRFGKGCEVLYLGDTTNKILYLNKQELERLKFFRLSHEELPDIIAYNRDLHWLYLIEAVHSNGPMSETRVLELKKAAQSCLAKLVFVTAFLTKKEFRKWVVEIAWETEVWVAETPDHLIHFDGDKYLSPY
ncbi:MAG: restriction endonuclease [Acidobacteria bacterium]|nr:restriction endonuclease [Acidobacteriota bacterium]MBI3422350.1 restriction endonuclease [Acidobacteriota bacterium]